MAILRRTLLSVALPRPLSQRRTTPRRAERSIGSPQARLTAIEFFSLSCSHCAAFAREALPELRAKWIAPGKLRWVFYDFPTDQAALQAAVVARYLPAERYERFIDTLFATQDRWAFGTGNVADALWPLAAAAGMDRKTFDAALADNALQRLDRRACDGGRTALARRCHSQFRDQRQALYRGHVRPRICYNSR